uniref:Uncharacterized protein n=1 Tax=Panagrolaimus sp. ES5 TaxID=591445 RepID=A0AC34GMJ2_9BILA
MEEKKVGWNLWELDHHHGEMWESRFQISCKNPTCSKIAQTSNGFGLFREGIKPMWEDQQNSGRLTAKKIEPHEMPKIVQSFFNTFANDKNVNGIIYSRKKNVALWLNEKVERTVTYQLKKKFAIVCNREVGEIKFDNFGKSWFLFLL